MWKYYTRFLINIYSSTRKVSCKGFFIGTFAIIQPLCLELQGWEWIHSSSHCCLVCSLFGGQVMLKRRIYVEHIHSKPIFIALLLTQLTQLTRRPAERSHRIVADWNDSATTEVTVHCMVFKWILTKKNMNSYSPQISDVMQQYIWKKASSVAKPVWKRESL